MYIYRVNLRQLSIMMKQRPLVRYRLNLLTYILSLILLGCQSRIEEDGQKVVFRYNEHKNIGSLDPAFAKDLADIQAVNQLFNGLVELDDSLQIKPCIAKNWEISKDGKTYIFTLRNDVYFHDNEVFKSRKVIASDFEYSFNRLLDPNLSAPGSWVFDQVSSFNAVDEHTFEIKLRRAFPPFLSILGMKYCSVVPHEAITYYGTDFRKNPVGTGPFMFKRWEENLKLVFVKNPNYFQKDSDGQSLPYIDAVAVTFIPDKLSEFLAFSQGKIDFLTGLDASFKDDLLTANGLLKDKYHNKVKMLKGPYLNTEYLAFYMDSEVPEVQSKLIRSAMNHGIDRVKMMAYLRNGIGKPAEGGMIPKGLPGYRISEQVTYNPELARLLISQYKNESGQSPKLSITTTDNYLSFCEYIQRELSDVGLEISISVTPAATLKTAKANGKLDAFRASWVADYPDAENYLSLFLSSNFAPRGPNYTHFNSKQFDDWYHESQQTTDFEARTLLYQKMDSIVMETAPVIPLFYDEVVRFTQSDVEGLGMNPANLLDLRTVKKIKMKSEK